MKSKKLIIPLTLTVIPISSLFLVSSCSSEPTYNIIIPKLSNENIDAIRKEIEKETINIWIEKVNKLSGLPYWTEIETDTVTGAVTKTQYITGTYIKEISSIVTSEKGGKIMIEMNIENINKFRFIGNKIKLILEFEITPSKPTK